MKAQQSFKVSRTPHQSQCYHIPKDLNIQSAIWIFWICVCVCVGGGHLRYLSCRGVLIFGFVNTHDICHVLISIFDSEQYHLSFTAECCEGHHNNTTDLWWCSSQSGSIPVTSLVDAVLILTQKTRQLKGSWWILQCYRKVVMRIRGLLSGDFGLQSLCGDCQNQRVRLILLLMVLYGQDSSVGIATRHGLDGPGIESQWDFPHPSRPATVPTQPPIQWVPDLSQGKAARAWRLPPTPI